MLHHSELSEGFWAEALLTTMHIINMSLSRPLGSKIPQELWTGKKPDYGKLPIFRCEAYALVPRDERSKLESRSRNAFFSNMDLTDVSAIAYGTRRLTKSSEVWTWTSTRPQYTRLPIA
jgi:hypothetical protein